MAKRSMNRNDIYDKIFELEFCEPNEKAAKEQALKECLNRACVETGTPFYVLKPAILKTYPKYRLLKLRREMPQIAPDVSGGEI